MNNQETTGGTSQFAYDGNGNPTTYKGSTFAFDESDKLTRITTSGVVSLQAGYRSDGLRAWKNTSNGTTYFLYDGDQLVCEFDGNGTLKNTNVWGANGLLARQSGSTLTNFVWDDRGNIAQKLNANGTVATNFTVSAYGDVTRDNSASDAYFGLGGQFGNYFDVETGLLLCGQRYYDSGAGRWINRDPISYAGGLNVYGYVGNNPVNAVDPKGKFPWLIVGGVVVAGAAGTYAMDRLNGAVMPLTATQQRKINQLQQMMGKGGLSFLNGAMHIKGTKDLEYDDPTTTAYTRPGIGGIGTITYLDDDFFGNNHECDRLETLIHESLHAYYGAVSTSEGDPESSKTPHGRLAQIAHSYSAIIRRGGKVDVPANLNHVIWSGHLPYWYYD